MQSIHIKPVKCMRGTMEMPGDKSIAHRSVLLAALAATPVVIKNFLFAADCLSTVTCLQALGVQIMRAPNKDLLVTGKGLRGLTAPQNVLDAGNSGTTARLLTGILAGQSFFSVLTGDASLRSRPMERVVLPLRMMGADIAGREEARYLPIAILPAAQGLHGIDYQLPVASAQVKSAILLATLYANSPSSITELYLTRDHTERMLALFGVNIQQTAGKICLEPGQELCAPAEVMVPGDISAAAFWLIAATIIPHSHLIIKNVGINPTRTGIIDVLQAMGANITITPKDLGGTEPVADLEVVSAQLRGIEIDGALIPRLIDEIPILAVAALFATGCTVIKGAVELRFKETDRLRAIAQEFTKMGAHLEETTDGLIIPGGQTLKFAACDSYQDHRIAMALAIAGAAAQGVVINQPECVGISYPDFYTTLASIVCEV